MADLFSRLTPRATDSSGPGGGSLFAPQTTTSQPAGASLFSGASGTSSLFGAQPGASSSSGGGGGGGGGLFGATAQPAPSAGSSLFGNNGAATSRPSGSSLFGATAANPTSQPPAGASLFSGNTNTNNATSQAGTTGTSLFGNTSNAPYQPPNSLFASTANANVQSQQNPNASVFGNDIFPSQQTQRPIVERAYNPNAALPQPAYFQALLDKGSKRMADDNNGLPQLQLGLQDISRKVRNIGQGGPSAGLGRGATNTRSAYLLGASGVNVGQSLRDIEELASSTAARPQAAPDMPDYSSMSGVKEFLGQQHRNNFENMIATRLQQAQTDFDKMIDEELHGVNWDAHMQRIYEHFGLKKPQDTEAGAGAADDGRMPESGAFGRSSRRSRIHGASTLGQSFGLPGMSRSVIGTPGPRGARQSTFGDVAEKLPADGMRPAPEDRIQRIKQEKYAGKVKDLNIARLQEKAYPIMHRFSEVEAEPSNEDTSMLVNAYKALVKITGEDASKENVSDPGVIKERQYAAAYLDEIPNSRINIDVRKRVVNGSRDFLEKLFLGQLEATVSKNPREANIGGVPTAIAKVKGYVRVRAARKELGPDIEILQDINGDYCWAVLFYMLRSGLYRGALDYVLENAAAFRQIDRGFTRYLQAFVNSEEHRLTPDMQTLINNAYSTRERLAPEDSIDPYRMMCYKVIGRCDLQRRSLDGITNDMMDWMWLQFALTREYNRVDEMAHEAFGLDELRDSITKIGERYFGPGSDIANAPTTYFFMQILAGMFEKAVADLYPHNYVSATHFAIALDFYGLLRVSADVSNDDLLTLTTRQQPQIAFGSMIGLYTRDFRTANATWAVDYLCLICLNADLTGDIGKTQRELCHQALIEVILETREFAQLLGDIRSDGQRIMGAVEQRLKLIKLDNEREFLKHITLTAARTAEDQSRVTDAALLFHLAEDYDKVIQIINEAVAQSLMTELGEQPARITPLRPRTTQQQLEEPAQGSSLSLTAVDDPIQLARNMTDLYSSNGMYINKITDTNRDCCRILLKLADAKNALEKGKWGDTIDHIGIARLLPSNAHGNMSDIRAHAQAFNVMPAVVARTIGHVMLWTVVACSNLVDQMRTAEFETEARRETHNNCVQIAKDVMVFAGLIRYKLPGRVWETLARAGQELGAY
ncbi:hypothetical protein LTR36_000752 [Oleoguttula mirabilis]|uniref:Nuclear pore protein n=1 Tax=Oleoguttula mirabilis TaxID=1507867 RepID=A0AAV9JR02_9PEZI|nr:hypothetical protein LTR36_000752 [Oleoguttula mirabilis]